LPTDVTIREVGPLTASKVVTKKKRPQLGS
jgi:hypothetical protein